VNFLHKKEEQLALVDKITKLTLPIYSQTLQIYNKNQNKQQIIVKYFQLRLHLNNALIFYIIVV
jgi:hypothetical protein